MRLRDVLFSEEYICHASVEDIPIEQITSDPNCIKAHTLFVLIPGVRFDTTVLLPFVYAKAPALIVAEEALCSMPRQIPLIQVKNARRALSVMLYRFYGLGKQNMKFIAVTGTNGKTGTATMLAHILQRNGYRVGAFLTGRITIDGQSISPLCYTMTTPDPAVLYPTLQRMEKEGCHAVVMEVSSHSLALCKVDPIPFSYALFTGLSHEHMDFHPDMEDYFQCKKRLFTMAEHAVINIDDDYGARLYQELKGKKTALGALRRGDVYATSIENLGLNGVKYLYRAENYFFLLRLRLAGLFHVYNSMMALYTAIQLGILPKDAKTAMEEMTFIPGRMEAYREDITVILDYAHTEEALRKVLLTVYKERKDKKIYLVFGCGGMRDRQKRPKMAKAAEQYADMVIVTEDNSRTESPLSILRDIVSGFEKENHLVISNRRKAILYAITHAAPGDHVIIAGKGHEAYTINKHGFFPFDERAIVKEAFEMRKAGYTADGKH